ncbi:hypothetical protein HKX48_002893 [Thoreauomyces humboldtii]|nr:hypothetical protein HKX48_002893 [Thoreauomyces humboldtii]
MVENPKTWYAILSGTALGFFIVYVPFVNGECLKGKTKHGKPRDSVFLTSWKLDPIYLLIPIVFGGILLLYSVFRKLVIWKVTPEEANASLEALNMLGSNAVLSNKDPPPGPGNLPATATTTGGYVRKKRLPALSIGRTVTTDG